MRPAVRDAFLTFSTRFEGAVPWMYLDILGLVTTGIGNLIDPLGESCLGLPWVYKGTTIPAPRETIRREWEAVKANPNAAKLGHRSLEVSTSLRLTPDGIRNLVLHKLDQNEAVLKTRFACRDHEDCRAEPALGAECPTFGFLSWPADAQLATHSMAWACGPAFRFPLLATALRQRDFAAAAKLCHIDDSRNPGVTPRNAANVALYELAARVVAEGLDPDTLLYGMAHTSTLPAPANDTEAATIEGGTVHPLVPLSEPEPPEAA